MDEQGKKLLTVDLLGECWHEFIDDPPNCFNTCLNQCRKMYGSGEISYRTFATPDDMMAVKEKLVEKGLLIPFSIWAWENRDPRLVVDPESNRVFWEEPYMMWFWELINPARFCDLAQQFLRERKLKRKYVKDSRHDR
jgi:hypothetical protein